MFKSDKIVCFISRFYQRCEHMHDIYLNLYLIYDWCYVAC